MSLKNKTRDKKLCGPTFLITFSWYLVKEEEGQNKTLSGKGCSLAHQSHYILEGSAFTFTKVRLEGENNLLVTDF